MPFTALLLFLGLFLSCNNTRTLEIPIQESNENTYPVKEYTEKKNLESYATAVFAGGCFWCTEAAFERIEGVVDVISGYSGGQKTYPGYYEVGNGTTGHAEAIYIYYDRDKIDYETLLNVFFIAHDPTTLNRQGPDVGEEYRSAVFYQTDEEKTIIEKLISELEAKNIYEDKFVTEVSAYDEFWVAEGYHQNYYELHPDNSYVSRVSRPKVEKVLKTFPALIKAEYRK